MRPEEGEYYVVRDGTQVRGPMRKDTRFSEYQWTDGIFHWDDDGRSMSLQDWWRDLEREATKEEQKYAITRSWLNDAQID